jgi:hypothetical protein
VSVLRQADEQLCSESRWDFSDLTAIYVNCALKRSPEISNTRGLADHSIAIMQKLGVSVEVVLAVDHEIATGVWPDMTEHGWDRDDWPAIIEEGHRRRHPRAPDPDLAGSEIIGVRACHRVSYGNSHPLDDNGQWAYYGFVGGCIVTGNEAGIKHCAMSILYSLQHLGYVIPPQADAGWIGEAGPGPSYLDAGSGGPENDLTARTTTFMTWNCCTSRKCRRTPAGSLPTATIRALGMRNATSRSAGLAGMPETASNSCSTRRTEPRSCCRCSTQPRT